MKKTFVVLACVLAILSIPVTVLADDDLYGIIESRSEGKVGTWVVGGRSVEVTERTYLEEEHGPLNVGACAEVKLDGDVATKIESKPPAKCGK